MSNERMAPPNAQGVELCYETFGDPGDPALLLVMGLGTQMLGWDSDLCGLLAGRGLHVVRYDNRDCGRSTRIKGRPPTLAQMAWRDKRAAVYTVGDMAADGISLLDHLEVEAAHVAGASMGGMIAQLMAVEHQRRVLTLTSIMSNAGGRLRGQPRFDVLPRFLQRAPEDREGYANHIVAMYELVGSPGFDRRPEVTRARALASFERGVTAAGTGRQLMAVLADGSRRARLARITCPTLVVHGGADRLVAPSGGRETARAIPGARLVEIPGMGHDLPRGAWPQIVEEIATITAEAPPTASLRPLQRPA